MTMNLSKISAWLEIVWKVAVVILAVGVMWLNSHYVSREEFDKNSSDTNTQFELVKQQIRDVERAVLLLTEQQKANDRQDVFIGDHEGRIRSLERTTTMLVAKSQSQKGTSSE